jgi:hypothetical protein
MALEIVGITLAYIEIRYKRLARRIEARIVAEENKITRLISRLIENKVFVTVTTLFFMMIFFVVIPYWLRFYDRILTEQGLANLELAILCMAPIMALFVGGLLVVFFGDFVSWLNRFSDGHAIGALGVTVTFLGLLGETYQVITILLR